MSRQDWSRLHEWLNELQSAMSTAARGSLVDVEVDSVTGDVLVTGSSPTFYSFQVILTAIKRFLAQQPALRGITLDISVMGHSIRLSICDQQEVERRPLLEMAHADHAPVRI